MCHYLLNYIISNSKICLQAQRSSTIKGEAPEKNSFEKISPFSESVYVVQ